MKINTKSHRWRLVLRVALLGLLITVGLIKPTASASPAKETGALAPLPTMVPGPELGLKPTSGYARGYRPPRANVGHLSVRNQLARPQLAQPLPSRWDWRDQAAVTGVRNQGECGSCYAFAGLGSLEAQLLIRGAGLYDFSENNIAECSYEPAGCEGGNIWIVANRLSSYGAVAESCDPYNPATQPCKTTCPPIKMVDEVWILGDSSVPDTTLLKTWLYRYGPLYVTMDSGSTSPTWDQEFAQYKGRYTLYHPDIIKLDHAVLLVGWDDNLIHAGGSGAWIVKNSWGVNWGAGGYFTMAYGSAGLGSNPALIAGWHEPKSAERLLFLDEGGWQREYGWMSQLGAWGMVRLIPSQSGCIDQVELWTTDRTRQVDVYLYDSFDGQAPSGLLRQLPRQAFEFPGYHKIAVDPPLAVVAGNDIYLAAYIENESYWASIAVDDLGPASSGRSFVSANGAAGSWQDLGATFRADVAFRARMASCAAMTTPTATPTRTPTITATPSRTAQPTMTPTGPTRTSLPKVPRLWLPPVLRQYQSRATPTPTATLSMTSTATPTPTFSHTPEKTVVPTTPAPTMPATLPANWVLDWAEDFSQPGAFLEGEWPGFHVHRERGEYRIEILATRQAVPSSPGRLYQDVALEVQGRFAAKESGNYGLVLATNDLYDGYYFRVNDQGQYGLRAKAGFGWQDVIPWTWSEHVHRGLTPNRLRMERVGSFLYLYLNGNHISTVRREEMPSQLGIALVAGSHDSVPVDMRFDNFQVYVPADARTGLGGGERRSRAASVKED